jgi:hypothetical protein
VSAAELRRYGWERDGLVWKQKKPHLAIVPDRPARTPKRADGRRDYRTSVCECGGPKAPRSKRCRSCSYETRAPRKPAPPASHASDEGVDEVMAVLARNLMATPAPRLPVHLCDCGCLLRLDEGLCPECRSWAERNAIVWSWSA